jgi:TonB family protein
VSYDVRPDGKTDGFEIEKSDPAGVFDKAALRAVLATEYEPAAGPRPRQRRSLWFIVARPPRSEFSKVNDIVEEQRNKRREEQRVACEGAAA